MANGPESDGAVRVPCLHEHAQASDSGSPMIGAAAWGTRQFLRPVNATVMPRPIIAIPPAPPTNSRRRGERPGTCPAGEQAPGRITDRRDEREYASQQEHLGRDVPV